MSFGPKIRSTQGCWTCRLRRKKCDELKPTCSICGALEITCFYSDKKPDWMDGGALEKEMADRLKEMVKAKANERREKKWAEDFYSTSPKNEAASEARLSQSMSKHTLEPAADQDDSPTSGSASYTPAASVAGEPHSSGPATSDSASQAVHPMTPFEAASEGVHQATHANLHMTPYSTENHPDVESEREISFAMVYLDYVFPYMFPFYQPPLLQGGRGWLLVLLLKNKPLYHTALSLASHFFSVIAGESILGHKDCQKQNWLELQKQQELSIQALQASMQCLTSQGVANSFRECIKCLEGIIQLVSFDATIGNVTNWQMHLEAAASLFEQIIMHHSTDETKPWYSILTMMDPVSISIEFPNQEHPWSSNQASFRFLTMNLLWTDILASTALGRSPRLGAFYPQLLEGDIPALQASDFLGCQNWLTILIGQIAALQAWKKEMRRARTLSMIELVKKASCIEGRLRAGIETLGMDQMDMDPNSYDPSARAPKEPFAGSGYATITDFGKLRSSAAQARHTKIWAKAALVYLAVTVSGFQPQLPDIQTNVAEIMDHLRALPRPLCLRTMVWPFAIAGCLSLPGQEHFFRERVEMMGPMQVFGTVKEALQIMHAVWDHRSLIDPDLFDISTCLNLLGHPSLLV